MAAKVLYAYASTQPDELILLAGEVLEVLRRDDEEGEEEEGWWRCRNWLGEEGVAPANYLQELPLPEGWSAAKDEESGEQYYFNEVLGEVQWEYPIPAASPAHERQSQQKTESGGGSDKVVMSDSHVDVKSPKNEARSHEKVKEVDLVNSELPHGWTAHLDKASGDKYYHHEASGESSWEKPKIEKENREQNGKLGESTDNMSSLQRMREEANAKVAALRDMVNSEKDKASDDLQLSAMAFGQDTHHAARGKQKETSPEQSRSIHQQSKVSHSNRRPDEQRSSSKNPRSVNNISDISLDQINKLIEDRVLQELVKREQEILTQVEAMMKEKFTKLSDIAVDTPAAVAESKKKKKKKQQEVINDNTQLSSRSAESGKISTKNRAVNKTLSHPDLLSQLENEGDSLSPSNSNHKGILEQDKQRDDTSSTTDSLFPKLKTKGNCSNKLSLRSDKNIPNEDISFPSLVKPEQLAPSPERKSENENFESGALNTIIPTVDDDSSSVTHRHKEEAEGNLHLKHVHGYDGSGGTGKNIHWLSRSVVAYPAIGLVVLMNVNNSKQQFYRGHTNEVTCLSVHPNKELIVSGQLGKEGRILVWDSSLLFHKKKEQHDSSPTKKIEAEQLPEKNVMKELFMEKTKGILGVDFSGDGRLLAAIGMHESSPVSIFNWSEGVVLTSVTLGHSDIYQVGFNKHLFNSQVDVTMDNQTEKKFCYTLVSCGSRSVKFWSLRRECEPVGPGAHNKVRAGGFKGRQLAVPKNKQKWIWKYALEGNSGSIPKKQASVAVEMTCFTAIPDQFDEKKHVLPQSKIFTGASNGCVYIWKHLEVARENADDDGYMYWLPRGSLLCVVSDVHDAPLYDIHHVVRNGQANRVATCSKDGSVNLWELNSSNPAGNAPPMEHLSTVIVTASDASLGNPRSIAYSGDGKALVVGTHHNCICTILGSGVSGASEEDGRDSIRLHTVISSNYGKGRCVAAHPFMDMCATVASDKTLRLWSVKAAAQVALTRISGCGSCVTFTPDGSSVAIGTETGEILILTCTYLQFCRENDAEPALDQKKPRWEILGRKFVGSKGANAGKKDVSKTEVTAMKYSPGGDVLAVATRDKHIHLMSPANGYKRTHVCKGHSGAVVTLDFSDDGVLLQSSDCIRETLFWESASGKMMSDVGRAHASQWDSWSNLLGPSMQGVCNGANPSDPRNRIDPNAQNISALIEAASRANDAKSVVVAGGGQTFQQHCLKLFKYPCTADAVSKEYTGHASAIKDVCFLNSDRYVVSLGGNDASLLVWVHR